MFFGFCSLYKQYIIEPTTEMISHTNFKFKNVYLELLLLACGFLTMFLVNCL